MHVILRHSLHVVFCIISLNGFISIQYQLPNTVSGSDSSYYTLTGYQLGICLGGKDLFYSNERFDLVYSWGVQFGHYYLYHVQHGFDDLRTKSRNGVIAPQVILETRYYVGNLKIGFQIRGQYDISNTGWKHVDFTGADYGGFAATGAAFQAVLGYKIR